VYTYKGILELYYETGYEGCYAVILHDDRGNYQSPGFNNATKKWDGPLENFRSLEWSVFMRGGETATIWSPRGHILYKGPLTKDKSKLIEMNYRIAFAPKELSIKRWMKYLTKEYKAEIVTEEPVLAEDIEYKERYKK